MNRAIFPGKPANETLRISFDFSSSIAVGETVSSASANATVYSGDEDATLTCGTDTTSGGEVSLNISGGTEGVTFLVTCVATTSAGQVLLQSGYVTIVPAGL